MGAIEAITKIMKLNMNSAEICQFGCGALANIISNNGKLIINNFMYFICVFIR